MLVVPSEVEKRTTRKKFNHILQQASPTPFVHTYLCHKNNLLHPNFSIWFFYMALSVTTKLVNSMGLIPSREATQEIPRIL
jgi:hypothetical protein